MKKHIAAVLAGCLLMAALGDTPALAAPTRAVDVVGNAVTKANTALAHGLMNKDRATTEARFGAAPVKAAADVTASATRATRVGDGYRAAASEGLALSAPRSAGQGVRATTREGRTFTVSLPQADRLREAALATDGATVIYAGQSGAPSIAVQLASGGIRMHAVFTEAAQVTDTSYTLGLARGERIVADESGFLMVKDARGQTVAYVTPAWAVDDAGRLVPTSYRIEGATITQHVDVSAPDITFPVVADPWLGQNLVDHATWSRSGPGWTFRVVTPTGWARSVAPVWGLLLAYNAGAAGWDELYARYGNGGLNTNLGGMRDQYICHMQFAWFKSTWNLDEYLPDVGYAATVAAGCNPQ